MTEFAIPLVTGQAACQSAEVAGRVRLPRAGGTDRGLTVMAVASVTALKCAGMGLQLHSPAAACPGRWPGSMGGPCGRCAWTCSSLAISSSPMCRSWSVYATCPGHRGGGGHPHQRGGKTRRNRRNRSTDAEVAFILNGKRLRTGQGTHSPHDGWQLCDSDWGFRPRRSRRRSTPMMPAGWMSRWRPASSVSAPTP
jgi:hypothetical protein